MVFSKTTSSNGANRPSGRPTLQGPADGAPAGTRARSGVGGQEKKRRPGQPAALHPRRGQWEGPISHVVNDAWDHFDQGAVGQGGSLILTRPRRSHSKCLSPWERLF